MRSIALALPILSLAYAAGPAPVRALQPLDAFVVSARTHSPDNAEAIAGYEAQEAQAQVALGRALPGISARGLYTRNEVQIPFGPIPALGINETLFLQRYNQLDGFATLNVPLVDLASFARIAAARTGAGSAEAQRAATALRVDAAVAQDYFTLVASQALVEAAGRALEVSKASLETTEDRFHSGRSAALDVDRARAEMERQNQLLIAAQLRVELSARALESSSGLKPDLTGRVALEDDLHEEPPLAHFEAAADGLPGVVAAAKSTRAAEQQLLAQRLALVPALAGSVTEHGTNAPSFSGRAWTYLATVSLTWQFDLTSIAAIRAQGAAADGARAREQRMRLLTHDVVHRSWATVASAIAQSRSARAQQQASAHASQLAKDRYEAGAATQLDLLQAQRDAFAADVARIQADADLANARVQLELAAGTDPFPSRVKP
jgi:outer membrane protein TolC